MSPTTSALLARIVPRWVYLESTHAVNSSTKRLPEPGFSSNAAFFASNSSPSSGTSLDFSAKTPEVVKLANAKIQLESTVRAEPKPRR